MTKQIKHTNGPWTTSNLRVHDANGLSVCEMSGPTAEDYANAKLVSASPELFDACVDALACMTMPSADLRRDEVIKTLKQAIIKAGGSNVTK